MIVDPTARPGAHVVVSELAVEIEGADGEAKTETVTGADAPPITVDLKPGEYTYYCPVGNHRAEGMEGKLTVR